MPRQGYVLAGVLFIIWGVAIWWLAHWLLALMPEKGGRLVELIGTLITLLPVMLDLVRKGYVRWYAPSPEDPGIFTAWALQRVSAAFLGFESLYAYAVFVGVSGVALGFAMDLLKPG